MPKDGAPHPYQFQTGDRVFFKNKQFAKWDLKWRAGYRNIHIECNGYYLHIENQATGKTRTCNVKDVINEPPVELWNVDTTFGKTKNLEIIWQILPHYYPKCNFK